VIRRFLSMVLAALAAGPLLFSAGQARAANPESHLIGGGTASISQVAMNVTINRSGSASGSFECLMAGRSGFVLGAFGLAHNMIVHATPTEGSVAGSAVTFSGPGSLILDGRKKVDVNVQLAANVGTQSFQLTVVDVATLPIETILTGQLSLT
jgi:hypothetical protein